MALGVSFFAVGVIPILIPGSFLSILFYIYTFLAIQSLDLSLRKTLASCSSEDSISQFFLCCSLWACQESFSVACLWHLAWTEMKTLVFPINLIKLLHIWWTNKSDIKEKFFMLKWHYGHGGYWEGESVTAIHHFCPMTSPVLCTNVGWNGYILCLHWLKFKALTLFFTPSDALLQNVTDNLMPDSIHALYAIHASCKIVFTFYLLPSARVTYGFLRS